MGCYWARWFVAAEDPVHSSRAFWLTPTERPIVAWSQELLI